MNRAVAASCLLGVALVSFLPGCTRHCAPRLADGWIRPGPASMPMRAGFGRIENDCTAPLAITGASSPAFGSVSLHRTTQEGGVSRMRAVPELVVPGDGSIDLAPGGLHLMLGEPRVALVPGQRVGVEFALGDGGTLRGELRVR